MFPKIDPSAYVDPHATILGDVNIGPGCSVWPGAVIRGDLNHIEVGEGTNVQDNAVVHATAVHATTIGKNVSIGHAAIVHGAIIGDSTIIGINATVLDGAVIGSGCMIGANCLVTAGSEIPDNSLVLGIPGKVVKTDPSMPEVTIVNAQTYHNLRDEHKSGNCPDWRDFHYTILPIAMLKEHEETKPEALAKLTEAVRADGELQKPILVDRCHHVVLDGHHRLNALKNLNMTFAPVYLVDYKDERIELDFWPEAKVRGFGKDEVIATALSGKVYPPKTTRHIIKIEVPTFTTSLDLLT